MVFPRAIHSKSDELSFIHVPLNPSEFQYVRMGQPRIPGGGFANLLGMVGTVFRAAKGVADAHFPYLQEVILLRNSHGLHCNEVPLVHSGPDTCEST